MPVYAYEALNAAGKGIRSEIEATSTEDAIMHIKSLGYFPTSVRDIKKTASKEYEVRSNVAKQFENVLTDLKFRSRFSSQDIWFAMLGVWFLVQ